MEYLEYRGFDITLVEYPLDYTVKIDKTKKYAAILKNSIESYERGRDRTFIMKDLASVEDAIKKGAVKYSHSSDISRRSANSDKRIRIKYLNLGLDENNIAHCEWRFTLSNIGAKKLFDIKQWVDKKVDLGRTARIWMTSEGDSLVIRGIGKDGRCEWCHSFFTALRNKATEEGIFVDEDWRCILEAGHPKHRYEEKIKRLLKIYR